MPAKTRFYQPPPPPPPPPPPDEPPPPLPLDEPGAWEADAMVDDMEDASEATAPPV